MTKNHPNSNTPARAKKKDDFWKSLVQPKVKKVRLGLDIPEDLDHQLTEKAAQMGQSKSELVRRLIEWGLSQD